MNKTIIVVSGGCVQEVFNNTEYIVIDFDNDFINLRDDDRSQIPHELLEDIDEHNKKWLLLKEKNNSLG